MLKFTDLFIKRPVLSVVLSLLILLLGLRAMLDMQVRQYPKMENTVITITTAYPGASAQLMSSFVTAPLEAAVAGADGIDYLTSESSQNVSAISAHIKLNYNPETAFTNIMSKVNEASGELPEESNKPIIEKNTGSHVTLMYISYSSKDMNAQQITDYIVRVVQPKLQTIGGVASAQIMGGSNFALRVWLDTNKMAALGLTPSDVSNALQHYNIQAAAGSTKGSLTAINISARTDLQSLDEFKDIPIKKEGDTLVRLKDIARVELGAENYDSSVSFNGKKAIFVAIQGTPTANPLTVISDLRKELPIIEQAFPPALQQNVVYDATQYIRSSIKEVAMTIIEASIIVVLVIYAFLGSLRTVIIPVVTIPLSLIGVCAFMLFLGYSINLLTLLAMVLSIGMVV
ncbi:MAG TPA: efflux RND transporter permease subunit, partial [Coxiellaceae bacterium]|nr:efflux RND transporter permease subunit [Coxiellaceae bacterium]